MSKVNNAYKTKNQWQPNVGYPTLSFEEDYKKANRKKIMLVSVYLVLLVGSLFVL